MDPSSTIFAAATPAGRSAIGIIRVSGPAARDACLHLTGAEPPRHRTSKLVGIRSLIDHQLIDRAMIIWFDGPNSATGDDILEIHHHGGSAVRDEILNELSKINMLRAALPGEFTKRAFFSGKLDLTEIEGLADLIDAKTRDQVRQAARQLDGELGALYGGWCSCALSQLALVEAAIDFGAEEGDVDECVNDDTRAALAGLRQEIQTHLKSGHHGERLRDGLVITIVGPPNVGKSSIFNRIAKRDAAIVSEIAGTTRDVIGLELDVGGVLVTCFDTAGLRTTVDAIEREGVRRAVERAKSADLTLVVHDASGGSCPLDGYDLVGHQLHVWNKIDQGSNPHQTKDGDLVISCKTGEGWDRFWSALSAECQHLAGYRSDESLAITNIRHRQCLEEADRHLGTCLAQASAQDLGLFAHAVRGVVSALGQISGRVVVDDVLDLVFSRFCIGK